MQIIRPFKYLVAEGVHSQRSRQTGSRACVRSLGSNLAKLRADLHDQALWPLPLHLGSRPHLLHFGDARNAFSFTCINCHLNIALHCAVNLSLEFREDLCHC